MPDLNLKDEEEFPEQGDEEQRPPRPSRYQRGGGDGMSKILPIAIVLLLILGVVMLNQFGIIHLWGSKDTPVVVDLPPLDEEEIQPIPDMRESAPAPVDSPATEPQTVQPPTREQPPVREQQPIREQPSVTQQTAYAALPPGSGRYTVQVSAWRTRERAEAQVNRIRSAGKPAFLDETMIDGVRWYRVRVGRYATHEEAARNAESFQLLLESGWWIDTIDG
jgi:cell division septation protein DedD